MTTTLKTCFKCSTEKPLAEFYPHKAMGDGHLGKCKECTKRDVKLHRERDPEKVREYDRKRANLPHRAVARQLYAKTLTGKLSRKKGSDRWSETNKHKKSANTAVSNAVRDGRLQKEPCFICGDEAEAHHSMYDEPLAVTWLCPMHHAQAHKEHRAHLRSLGIIKPYKATF